ncbi:BEM_HP_G0118600.mRNA.1.CDS.1 [Saccharomyces cerevisiae]|nr:BEM_HP_G0118600.mRNA.1.CDS.1 [Saccharomyces cerevisiae]CAI6402912.1 BEM_HP_G0118600.mRNA.1.CDS.1 [Saccharomyces cerevisiae]
MLYCTLSVDETLEKLDTDKNSGLRSSNEANNRRSLYGPNEITVEDDESLFKKFLSNFIEDRMILLLIGSPVVSLFMGNIDDAVKYPGHFHSCHCRFVQEIGLKKSLEALNKLVPAECHLMRDVVKRVMYWLPPIVPGDLGTLQNG